MITAALSPSKEFDRAKTAHTKLADGWSPAVMTAFEVAQLDRHAEEHSEFFKALYWDSPANSSLKINDAFAKRFAALWAATQRPAYVQVLAVLQVKVNALVDASETVEIKKSAKLAAKDQQPVKTEAAPVAPQHSHRLVKVTLYGQSYLGHFADGTTHVIRRTGRHYTLAALRNYVVNGNIKKPTAGSYVSLHSVAPTGDFLQVIPVSR